MNVEKQKKHIITLLVENRIGVLQRIAGVFSRRGFNLDSITVSKTQDENFSRMTITTKGDSKTLEKVIKQLNKQVDVIKVSELEEENSVVREIALIKIFAKDSQSRTEILSFVDIFRGRVVDVSKKSITVEITGDSEKISAFINLVRSFGIKDLVRTGITAISRGD